MYSAVMDVVSCEARSGLPSELLHADDLVIMAPTMEQLGRRVADWRASLLGKGLKVNAGKSKVMVGSSGGKMIINSGKWPCGVCGKGVQANSVQCTVCKKWIHKRCSGVRGELSQVADGFRCRRCDGTIQEWMDGWMKFRELLPFLTSRAPPLEIIIIIYNICIAPYNTIL